MDHATALRRFYDQINAGNVEGFANEVAENFIEHEEVPGLPPTKAGVVEYFRMLLAAFPDMHMAAEDVMACGDKVVARVVVTGTHTGPFMGMPATGKRVSVKVIDIIRFDGDGRACEHWGLTDQLSMMQQLGAIPAEPPR